VLARTYRSWEQPHEGRLTQYPVPLGHLTAGDPKLIAASPSRVFDIHDAL
jgi:hypothetical protein